MQRVIELHGRIAPESRHYFCCVILHFSIDGLSYEVGQFYKLEEIKLLRASLLDDARAVLSSAFHKIIEGAVYKPTSEVANLERRKVEIDLNAEYPELGVQ
ncbi:hypothetical protein NQT74_04840 [Alteromonas stellipolaris]|uniref:hypothetical protein n=1 Tax=Alteromonas stellipolaris TaxID=233316 RepID=UPI0021191A7E|nr:hypothetical protein [Alteromonas stellipolaris]MCQ8847896.1 hypothetical protein [Alteromonas stellipolaris]